MPTAADHLDAIAANPLSVLNHLTYARFCLQNGRHQLALAELRTARFLGAKGLENAIAEVEAELPALELTNHNQYFRLKSLADCIQVHAGSAPCSVLDVGGGNGELCRFIPEAEYVLVEPRVNGLSGTQIPFPDKSFDYVVSCHVLEHIPPEQRTIFLDQLAAKARRGVILLNPFHLEGTSVEERLDLVIEVTNANWAKEHKDCGLPQLEEVLSYAEMRGFKTDVTPNGNLTTGMALVFMEFFAAHTPPQIRRHLKRVNTFFNQNFFRIGSTQEAPNAYLIHLDVSRHAATREEPAERVAEG
jgi:SAM-dependent methyltransferase